MKFYFIINFFYDLYDPFDMILFQLFALSKKTISF